MPSSSTDGVATRPTQHAYIRLNLDSSTSNDESSPSGQSSRVGCAGDLLILLFACDRKRRTASNYIAKFASANKGLFTLVTVRPPFHR